MAIAMHWQLRPLSLNNSIAIPMFTQVLALRNLEQIVDYGNGLQGPERRLIVSLDRFDGLEWLHEGSGQYLGFYPIHSVLQWESGKIDLNARYLVRVGQSSVVKVGPYQPIPKNIYLAKIANQPNGLVWQCYQPGWRFRSTEDFIQKPRFISVPSNHITHWQRLPELNGHWFA